MKMNFKSIGFDTKCKCGELAKWQVIDDLSNALYYCERCFKKLEGIKNV